MPAYSLRKRIMRWTIALVLGAASLTLTGMKLVDPLLEPDISVAIADISRAPAQTAGLAGIDPEPLDVITILPNPAPAAVDAITAMPSPEPYPQLDDVAEREPLPPLANDTPDPRQWHTLTVKPGDSLAAIFARLGISAGILHEIVRIDDTVAVLKHIKPGQILKFDLDNGALETMQYAVNPTETLAITKHNGAYQAAMLIDEPTIETKRTSGVIHHSLFLSAKNAGLSDKLIMDLVSIYGWDIDFALDIREGDTFTVLYQEQYHNGVKVNDGPILAAEFVNQNKAFKTVRYTDASGRSDYYSESGHAMHKAFLRTPVNFTRISSKFSLARRHPVLNTIRAHRGVDYAAPTGTPVKTVGDGTVEYLGSKGGYGKTVIIDHGDEHKTVYAHLSKYRPRLKPGKWVEQGDIIGYVGSSGLATGPHLHYEFRIAGVHRNPLTLKLSKTIRIAERELPKFRQIADPLLAELDAATTTTSVALATESGVPDPGPGNHDDG